MNDDIVQQVAPLGMPWPAADPFLFCNHHHDRYPSANADMGPDASLAGRQIGQDFSGKDGWSMYHGESVPGFPSHPHRGFETITIARQGFIDHSDSLGARARFGPGDVQWMTAGEGIVHSEMFPLLDQDGQNPTELFQIWLNLAREDKTNDPYFTMFWADDVPRHRHEDDHGRATTVDVIAGSLDDRTAPTPPPSSWASRDDADIGVWTVEMAAGASWEIPSTQPTSNRMIYFFAGDTCQIGGRDIAVSRAVTLRPDRRCPIVNGENTAEFLVLQGRPIGERVVQQGPFVMNSPGEIRQTMLDYQRTQFGGWPWETNAPVHPRDAGRFAIHADGRDERPDG